MTTKNKYSVFLIRAVFLGVFMLCSATEASITIEGSSTILPIIKDAAKQFQRDSGIEMHVKGGGSETGIQAVIEGKADIGMVSRALTGEHGKTLTSHLIGYDGIAVIVNSQNPLQTLNNQQIMEIFTGNMTNWKSLNGLSNDIQVVAKKKGRATRTLFDKYFTLIDYGNNVTFNGSNTSVIVLVGSNPHAIGYVSIGSILRAQSLGVQIKTLPLQGIAASQENVVSGRFPLIRRLNLVTLNNKPANSEVRRFIQFLQSSKGQAIVTDKHFIGIEKK